MSIYTNGTRLCFHHTELNAFVGYSTLHHRNELVTRDDVAAQYYVNNGLRQWQAYQGAKPRVFLSRVDRQLYDQWVHKMKAVFGDHVVVY